MIQVTDLSKSFGSQLVLDSISFSVNRGERIGLVGRNGHGKTTLLRIITGEEYADSGEITSPRGYRIGHASQHLNFTRATVIDEVSSGLPEHEKDETWKAEKILSGLGFTETDMKRKPSEFSGGYQVRLNLARLLVSDPDLLLLDEPTNYLDIISIRWLADFLRSWKKELILVTHDRSFMDSVITHTLGIHRKKARKITGCTDALYEQILKEEEIYEKTRINDEKRRKETEDYIRRFRAKARLAGMVQSRIKALDKQEKLDKLERIQTLDFSFTYRPTQAKMVLDAREITFSYTQEGKPLIADLSFTVKSTDRICVIGKNGRGKTTLLRMLAGELEPMNGAVMLHPTTDIGYYAQTNTLRLNTHLTIEEEIMNAGCERQRARDIAGAMMFEGDMALKKIAVLSGGEKSRVLLGKILATPCNLLLLDEPTNHLDMESCDAFMGAVDDFPGAAMIVTHNELFLHALANRFIVFEESGVRVFEGSYQDFLDRVGWEDERDARTAKNIQQSTLPDTRNRKDLRKLRADIQTRKSRELGPIEKKIASTEAALDLGEKEIHRLENDLVAASAEGDGTAITTLSRDIHRIRGELDLLYEKLDELTVEYETLEKKYEQELADLE